MIENEQSLVDLECLARNNEDVRAVLDVFSGYERNRAIINVASVARKLSDNRKSKARHDAVYQVFREFQRIGLGELKNKRPRAKSQFTWKSGFRLQELSSSSTTITPGSGSDDQTTAISCQPPLPSTNGAGNSRPPNEIQPHTISNTNDKVARISHQFMVRPDFAVRLELPTDFTPSEADRLATFVRTLPFNTSNTTGEFSV